MFKRKGLLIACGIIIILLAMAGTVYAQEAVSLREAIYAGTQEIIDKLAPGTTVGVLHFNSPSESFSAYMMDEIETALVQSEKLRIVDRSELTRELRNRELVLSVTGEVSDATAQAIGITVGAQSIVVGSFVEADRYSRVRLRTIEVETGVIQAFSVINVHDTTPFPTRLFFGLRLGGGPNFYVVSNWLNRHGAISTSSFTFNFAAHIGVQVNDFFRNSDRINVFPR